MKHLKATAIFITSLMTSIGMAGADERSVTPPNPGDASQETSPGTTNKLEGQDLSDKAMRDSQKGANTEIIRTGFKRLDSNDDGSITSDEASLQPPLNTQFKIVDKNSDNKLDMSEFARFAEENSQFLQNE